MNVLSLATHGLNAPDVALAIARVATGTFFALSGANKLLVPSRHRTIKEDLVKNRIPCIRFMEWWVPGWEFVAGTMLALGFLSAFAAGVLLIICLVASCCEARDRVNAYQPINTADRIDDYLYLPEIVYIVLLIIPILAGTGRYSFDALL